MAKLVKTHRFVGQLVLKTGLHIGGNKDTTQIGGVDSQVIKIKENGKELPYIPGSSLKGKLRSLLEIEEGKSDVVGDGEHIVSKLFGCGNSKNIKYPGAVIIRDAFLVEEDKKKDKKEIFEIKAENKIIRTTGTAKDPRFIERVNPGLRFNVEIIIREFDGVKYEEIKNKLVHAFELLKRDYLGGSGTRGYGKVDVSDIIDKLKNNREVNA